MNNNGRPLPARKQVQLMLALTLLAWATQTLLAQWGRGAEVTPPPDDAEPSAGGAASAFVPRDALAGATLELRGEATVYGGEVKLKQVCRWSRDNAATFAPVADLVIARLDARRPFKVLDVNAVRQTLADAGVNVSLVRFSGPIECTVSRSDVELGEGEALEEWIQAHRGGTGRDETGRASANAAAADDKQAAADDNDAAEDEAGGEAQPAALRESAATSRSRKTKASAARRGPDASLPDDDTDAEEPGLRTLRSVLRADLSVRLSLAEGQVQLAFDPRDESALNLAEPAFKFNVEPRRVRDLGEVAWDVTIVSDTGSRKAQIRATARAWQQQVLLTKPLARGQVIQASDVTARRSLVDRLPGGALLAADQVVGQVAAREMRAGTLVTGALVEALPMAKVGQFITVTLSRGGVRIKSVGKAMEGGSFGQTIRVKNEATRDVYQVVLTGPQEATLAAPDATGIEAATANGVASLPRD